MDTFLKDTHTPFLSPCSLLRGLRVLLHVLVDAAAHGGRAVATLLARAHTDDARVHGARDAVLDLRVDLRETVVLHDRRVAEIAERRRLNDVPHDKALHRLVLGDTAAAVAAAHDRGVATVLLRATSVATLESHPDTNYKKKNNKQTKKKQKKYKTKNKKGN